MERMPMTSSLSEKKRKYIELLILLILGDYGENLSVLHIQKEIFLLWNFDKEIRKLYSFIKHYKGPYLDLINECAREPFFFSNCWDYTPPKRNEINGGFLRITYKGHEKYINAIEKFKNNNQIDILHIINAISILNRLYANLDSEELLLLIYTEFPEFTEKSEVYSNILSKKEIISKRLLNKELINEEKYEELVQ